MGISIFFAYIDFFSALQSFPSDFTGEVIAIVHGRGLPGHGRVASSLVAAAYPQTPYFCSCHRVSRPELFHGSQSRGLFEDNRDRILINGLAGRTSASPRLARSISLPSGDVAHRLIADFRSRGNGRTCKLSVRDSMFFLPQPVQVTLPAWGDRVFCPRLQNTLTTLNWFLFGVTGFRVPPGTRTSGFAAVAVAQNCGQTAFPHSFLFSFRIFLKA